MDIKVGVAPFSREIPRLRDVDALVMVAAVATPPVAAAVVALLVGEGDVAEVVSRTPPR